MVLYTCSDCSTPALARSSRAQRCSSCMVLAKIRYVTASNGPKRRDCPNCGERFALTHASERFCGGCDERLFSTGNTVACVLCNKERTAPFPGVPLCGVCLKAPDQRKNLQEALIIGQDARKHRFKDPNEISARLVELYNGMPELVRQWALVSEADAMRRGRRKADAELDAELDAEPEQVKAGI